MNTVADVLAGRARWACECADPDAPPKDKPAGWYDKAGRSGA